MSWVSPPGATRAASRSSGGGPHALAVAAKLPDRILAAQCTAEDLARMAADRAKIFSDDWQLPASDREVLSRSDMQQMFAETMREAYRTGV